MKFIWKLSALKHIKRDLDILINAPQGLGDDEMFNLGHLANDDPNEFYVEETKEETADPDRWRPTLAHVRARVAHAHNIMVLQPFISLPSINHDLNNPPNARNVGIGRDVVLGITVGAFAGMAINNFADFYSWEAFSSSIAANPYPAIIGASALTAVNTAKYYGVAGINAVVLSIYNSELNNLIREHPGRLGFLNQELQEQLQNAAQAQDAPPAPAPDLAQNNAQVHPEVIQQNNGTLPTIIEEGSEAESDIENQLAQVHPETAEEQIQETQPTIGDAKEDDSGVKARHVFKFVNQYKIHPDDKKNGSNGASL